jgi:hypothetical protein
MDNGKVTLLLDDPEARVIVYGLAHVHPAAPTLSGPERLRGILQRLVDTAEPAQAQSCPISSTPSAPRGRSSTWLGSGQPSSAPSKPETCRPARSDSTSTDHRCDQ